ncbi:4063_t:CDS:2 [Funneliformis geosporum]|uniref:4063_t:CDS:1 n=1 Tax=Funneliformis geosporum TaxID=1117311 RepID=A0A9W4SU28_9GLOM|nr:4063_t:CDS:2 [Funneliformis geosporum]
MNKTVVMRVRRTFQESYKEIEIQDQKKISFQNANYLGKPNYDDGTECWNTIKNNNEKYSEQKQQINNNVKDENHFDITMVQFEFCPNQERIRSMQLSLGQLCRIRALAGNAWTKEKPKTPCRSYGPERSTIEARVPETMLNVPNSRSQNSNSEKSAYFKYDGTVTEFENALDDLPNELAFDKPATKTIDIHPAAKKKRNSKKNIDPVFLLCFDQV